MEYSSAEKIRRIPELVDELFRHVLYDEEPIFISDEATIWDVSAAAPEELLKRCTDYYQRPLSLNDLRKPLWVLLPEISKVR